MTCSLLVCLLLALMLMTGLAAARLEELPAEIEGKMKAALAAAAAATGGGAGGCGTAALVIVSPTGPSDLTQVLESQPPLPRLPPVERASDVELLRPDATCLSSLKRVRGSLLLLSLPDGALNSLSSLETVGEALIIFGGTLTSLSGLDSLKTVGHLAIAEAPALANVQGLSALRAVNGGFTLWRLPELQSLDFLGPLETVFERVWIQDTPKLLSLGRVPQLPQLPPVQLPPQITKQQQQTTTPATGLTALRQVGLDLHIDNTDLPSLDLPFLTSVKGEIALFNNRRLATTQNVRALTSAFGLALYNNDLLADVDGFRRLTELKGDLSLVRNRALQSVNGFKSLVSVGLTVDVSSNPTLRSLDGFAALTTVGQMLNVAFNPSLEALRGFGALRSVGGDLIVRNNTQMRELTDLGAVLESVGANPAGGSLIVEDNPALVSLAPLASPPLRLVRGAVRVRKGNGGEGVGGPAATALEALAQPNFTFFPAEAGAAAAAPAAVPPPPAVAPAPVAPPAVATPAPPARALPATTPATTTPTPMGGAGAAATTVAATTLPPPRTPGAVAADPGTARFLNNLVRG